MEGWRVTRKIGCAQIRSTFFMRPQTHVYLDASILCAKRMIHVYWTAAFICRWPSGQPGCRKEQDPAALTNRSSHSVDGLVGILFSTVRRAYGPVSLPGDGTSDGVGAFDVYCSSFQVRGGGSTEREGVSVDSATEQRCSGDLGLLTPGCGKGFGGGLLDLCLAEQASVLLRELYKVPSLRRVSLLLPWVRYCRALRDVVCTHAGVHEIGVQI